MATQNPNHPSLRPILDSVLINTRTHVVLGGLRAQVRHFTDEMAPTFSRQELDGLSAYHMAITTLVGNRPAPPFEAAVPPIPRGDPARAARIRERSRASCGKSRAAVEALVTARFRDLEVQTPTRDGDTSADPPTGSRETYGRADLPLRGEADTRTNGQEASA